MRTRSVFAAWLALTGCGDSTAGELDIGSDASSSGDPQTTAPTSSDETSTTEDVSSSSSSSSSDTGSTSTTMDASTDIDTGTNTVGSSDPPTAVADAFVTPQDIPLVLAAADSVLTNDLDPRGGPLVIASHDPMSTAGGTVDLAADGSLDYDPPSGHWGTDSFEYTVADEHGGTATATVDILVTPVRIQLADVADGHGGFAMTGVQLDSWTGADVDGLDDVNGDGVPDVLVGAPLYVGPSSGSGRAYVVHGKADTSLIDLADVVDGDGGFVIESATGHAGLGRPAAGVGDVDGDGLADLVLGVNDTTAGRAYLVHGKADTEPVWLADVANGVGGFVMLGAIAGDDTGTSVSTAGDVDSDGVPDLLVAAWQSDAAAEEAGRAYLVLGKSNTDPVALADVAAGIGGVAFDGAEQYRTARVGEGGDVNGDGELDVLIGARGGNPAAAWAGRIHVVFGPMSSGPIELAAVGDTVPGFVIDGENAGDMVEDATRAGDIDGDGLEDIAIGTVLHDSQGSFGGRCYVVFGKNDAEPVDLVDVAMGIGGFAIISPGIESFAGVIARGGDVNGDGLPDLLVGAPGIDRAYVVYGNEDLGTIQLANVAMGLGGFALDGYSAGNSIASVGDMNGDGLDDLVVGAQLAGGAGMAYVVFGVPTSW
jgi:hypothetical protein